MVFRCLAALFLVCASYMSALAENAPTPDGPIQVEILRLRAQLLRDVRRPVVPAIDTDARWIALTRAAIDAAGETIDHAQLLVVVDRNPGVQTLEIIAARPTGNWEVIGGSRVSTGQRGRFDHYITPVGVYRNTTSILGFRAEGTLNENGIRGYGIKGMRVWDFGWHVARKGWKEAPGKPDRIPIRLMLHATDPDRLEQRLGRPASQGCVRIPAGMNRFLDRYGVLDADYEQAAVTEIRFRALLLPNREPSPLAGDTLVVIDSSAPTLPVTVSARAAL